MSDLEQRLADALTHGAQGAPSVPGLAAAARSRARARRRNRLAGAAAVVALAVGVPTAIVATHGSDSHSPSRVANDPTTNSMGVPDGYRVESWHSVSIQVPDTWGYGGPESWCAGGGSLDTPRVSRPGGVNEDIACTPRTGYGIAFQQIDNTEDFQWPVVQQDPGAGWPPGAYVGARGIGGVLVTVVATTEPAGLDVLATMHAIGPEGDANGCPIDTQTTPGSPPHGMSVCRYDDLAQLEQSELLTGADVEAAEAALDAAPDGFETYCPRDKFQGEIRMVSADVTAGIDLGCGDLSVTPGAIKKLTPEVLYWALSPGWSGSVPDGVSLPSELRSP
jgi:hypothetical protein